MEIFWTLVIIAALVWVLKKINDSEKAKRQIICPNPHCGFRGEGRVEGSSSGGPCWEQWVAAVLLFQLP